MSTIFEEAPRDPGPDRPGTHVLIVGAGAYPHLLGGTAQLCRDPKGLGQLSSPPLSAVALANWFIGDADQPSAPRFRNPVAPLASVELLAAPCAAYRRIDGVSVPIDSPTRSSIERAYATWIGRASTHPENIAVFYFCGHGLTGAYNYLLPSDFGERPNPWPDVVDIESTVRAARRAISGAVYVFVDACRQIAFDPLTPGSTPSALGELVLKDPVRSFSALTLMATGEGQPAFAAKGAVSRFTTALIAALSGYYGERADTGEGWVVTGDALARAVSRVLDDEGQASMPAHAQHVEQALIGSQPFHYEVDQPQHTMEVISSWKANPDIRQQLSALAGAGTISEAALETLAERLEQQRAEIGALQAQVADWTARYRDLEQRLAGANDKPLATQARALLEDGKLEQAGEILDQLIAKAEAQLEKQQSILAALALSRAQVWSLQFAPLAALPQYRRACELCPQDPQYATHYARALLSQSDFDGARRVYTSALQLLRAPPANEPAAQALLGETLNGLGTIASNSGQFDEAESFYKEALEIGRALMPRNPKAFRDKVAHTLNNLAVLLARGGRFEEAERTYEQALSIFREVANDGVRAGSEGVAATLGNAAILYVRTQRFAQAEDAYREALATYRMLADGNAAEHLPSVARTLTNLAGLYSDTQRFTEAEQAYAQALGIRRDFAKGNPQAYLPGVAATLNNLGALQAVTGRFEEADKSLQEALSIRRKLAKDDESVYQPEVAETLNNLAHLYTTTKRLDDAEPLYKESVAIFLARNSATPGTHGGDATNALNNLATLHRQMWRLTEAESEFREALRRCRELVSRDPKPFRPELARTLDSLGNLLSTSSDASQLREAGKCYDEALEILRPLALEFPAVYLPQLGSILNNLSGLRARTGGADAAGKFIEEAAGIYRELASTHPDVYLPDLAMTLNNLGNLYRTAKNPEAAEKAYRESVLVRKRLAQQNRGAHLPALANTLNGLGALYTNMDRPAEAETNYLEALGILDDLARGEPQAYLPELAMTQSNLGVLYASTNRPGDAEKFYLAAIAIRRDLARANSNAHLPSLAGSLSKLGILYIRTQQFDQASPVLTEALEDWRTLARSNARSYLPEVALALDRLKIVFTQLGDTKSAIAAQDEARVIRDDISKQALD